MTNRRVPFNPWTAKMLTFSARGREVAQMRSTVIGVLMPEDFNTAAHNDISALLAGCVRTHATEWMHFASAWNAVAIRFHSLASADYAYQSLITGVRDSPERNCEVQQVLFDFFCRGASVIESFFHAIRAIGSISAPAAFPLNGDADLKDWPIDVLAAFRKHFANEPITECMNACLRSPEWREISDYRIVLFHRGSPPRTINLNIADPASSNAAIPSNAMQLASKWLFNQNLDPSLTTKYRQWIGFTTSAMLNHANEFCKRLS